MWHIAEVPHVPAINFSLPDVNQIFKNTLESIIIYNLAFISVAYNSKYSPIHIDSPLYTVHISWANHDLITITDEASCE